LTIRRLSLKFEPVDSLFGGVTQRTTPDSKTHLNWKRGVVDLALSIVQPGTGQIYNLQLKTAIAYFMFVPTALFVSHFLHLLHSLAGFALCIASLLTLHLYMIINSVWLGLHQQTAPRMATQKKSYLVLAIALAIANLVGNGSGFFLDHLIGLRAFKNDSDSMSPTLVKGDRIVADMTAYRKSSPKRGEVVAFLQRTSPPILYVKRVIAVGGDTISGTEQGIELNGKTLSEPYLDPGAPYLDPSSNIFKAHTVAEGKFSVMGDNRGFSYDSREFGEVEASRMRGRVLFIYWSHNSNRIGKSIQ